MERRLTVAYEGPPSVPPRLAAVRWGSAPSLPGLHKILHRASWSGPVGGSGFAEASSVPQTPGKRSDDGGCEHRCSTASAGVERGSRRFGLEEGDFLPRMGSVASTISIAGDLLREHRHILSFEMAQLEAEVLPLVHSPVEKFSIDAKFTANVHLTSEEEEMVRHVQDMRTSLSRLHLQTECKLKELKAAQLVHRALCLEQSPVSRELLAKRSDLQKQRLKLRESHEEAIHYHRSLQLMLKRMGEAKRNTTSAHSVMREDMQKVLFTIKEATARLTEANNAKEACNEQLLGLVEQIKSTRQDHKAELDFLRGCVAQITKRKEADKNQLMKEKSIVLDVGKQKYEKLKVNAKETATELASRTLYSSLQKRDVLEAKMEVYVKRIKERTGFSDPKEIVQRMLERHKHHMRIEVQKMKAQARLDDLIRERDVLIRQKQALEFSGQPGNMYRRSVIDEIDGRLMTASRRLRLAIHHHLQCANLLASLRSGIDSLAHNLGIHMGGRESSRRSRTSMAYVSEPPTSTTSPIPQTPPLPHHISNQAAPGGHENRRPRSSLAHLIEPSSPSLNSSGPSTPVHPHTPIQGGGGRPPTSRPTQVVGDGPPDESLMRLNFIHERLVRLMDAASTPWSEPPPVSTPRRSSVATILEDAQSPQRQSVGEQELHMDRTRFNVRVDLQGKEAAEEMDHRGVIDEEMYAVDSSRREYMRHPPSAKAPGIFSGLRRGRGDDEDPPFARSTWSVLQSTVDSTRKELKKRMKAGNLPILKEHNPNASHESSRPSSSRPRSGSHASTALHHFNRPRSPPTAVRSTPNIGATH